MKKTKTLSLMTFFCMGIIFAMQVNKTQAQSAEVRVTYTTVGANYDLTLPAGLNVKLEAWGGGGGGGGGRGVPFLTGWGGGGGGGGYMYKYLTLT
ncbi:MAG: hypothetical protein FWH39_05915, partial [Bacteroidales bacterium]|nr:hypothetical protein [Bacteroidales bacterium]